MKVSLAFLLSALACLAPSITPDVRGQQTAVLSTLASVGSNAGLTVGNDGSFYGTGNGTVFRLTPDGTLTSICNLPTGSFNVTAPLTEASDGSFYGTANQGGANGTGALFKVSTTGQFTLLYAFNALDSSKDNVDGAYPAGALVQASDGNFYGTAPSGGLNGEGTIFRLTPAGVFTPIHQFNPTNSSAASDGTGPIAGLTLGADGNLYGTTAEGGANGTGTVFKITTDGALTTLYNFSQAISNSTAVAPMNGDGAYPVSGLTPGKNDNFFGTTDSGGKNGGGTIYKITASGVLTTLYNFPDPPPNGNSFAGSSRISPIIKAADGDFYGTYGTTSPFDGSTVFFQLTPAGVFTSLASEHTYGGNYGYFSITAPVQGPDGNFYVTGTAIFKIAFQPIITSAGATSAYANYPFLYQITATDGATTFGATGLPTGLSVDPATGLISGTPTVTGNFSITLTASNGTTTGTGSLYLSITVAPPPPVLTTALNATGQVGANFSFRITATHAPTGFGADGLPPGLTVNSTTGLISGQPTTEGTFQVTLGAANVSGLGTAPLTLTVLPPPPAPVITSSLDALSTYIGIGFQYAITATNNPASFAASGLPDGLSLDTMTGIISGASTETGTFNITISATNGGGSASATLTLTVNPTPAITSPDTAIATLGVPFSFHVTNNFRVPAYDIEQLSPGLSADFNTGLISGTPTMAGVFTVQVYASGDVAQRLTLTVLDAPTTVAIATGGDGTAQAGAHNGKLIVARTGGTGVPLTVHYKVKGAAKPGTNYNELPGSVTIPAGASKAKIKIKPIDNLAVSGPLVVKIKLRADAQGGFKLGVATTAKVMILPAGN